MSIDPDRMTRVHHLFNELHKELVSIVADSFEDLTVTQRGELVGEMVSKDERDITTQEAQVAMTAFRLDALHHDLTNITLEGAVD